MNTLRPIRLKKPWRTHQPGHIYEDMPAGAAGTLVARGYAEYLDEQVQRAPVDRMMRPASRSTRHKSAPAA